MAMALGFRSVVDRILSSYFSIVILDLIQNPSISAFRLCGALDKCHSMAIAFES